MFTIAVVLECPHCGIVRDPEGNPIAANDVADDAVRVPLPCGQCSPDDDGESVAAE